MFIGALHSVPQTTLMGKRQFLCGFVDFSSLGQKLPFLGIKTAVLRINHRFRGHIFVRAIFGDFSSSGQKLPFCDKFAVFRT